MKQIVIKLGTASLTDKRHALSKEKMLEITRQVAKLHASHHRVVLVSSGSIAAGRAILNNPKLGSLPQKQMLSSVGQVHLMHLWAELFSMYNITVGQILLTRRDFHHRTGYLNVRNTALSLLDQRVIPIVNENDTVATQEIKVGDNDNISALFANLIAADLLIILTDCDGLFSKNPKIDPQATLIPVVETIDESIIELAKGAEQGGLGTGGMVTKVEACRLATQSGTPTIIANASKDNILIDLIDEKPFGTLFKTNVSPKESKKRWLLSKKPQGTLTIDQGAQHHLVKSGASLLPVGIKQVSKEFKRGAIIEVISESADSIALGICNYSSDEVKKIIGKKSDEIESMLGYTYGPEVIHRDNMALL